MMRSLYSGVAGLKTHQTKMDVIGNNIANVNTVGYKSQGVTFNSLMYQTTQAASAANANTGGTNAKQIGLGVKVGAISTTITGQGSAQTTGTATDLMITGENFFVVSNGGTNYFTRDGSFTVDGVGNLVMSSTGYNVMGWGTTTDADGNLVIRTGKVEKLGITTAANLTYAPEATSAAYIAGILDKSDTDLGTASGKTMNLTVYDNKGNPYSLKLSIRPVSGAETSTKEVTNTEYKYTLPTSIKFADNSNLTFEDSDGNEITDFDTPAVLEALQKSAKTNSSYQVGKESSFKIKIDDAFLAANGLTLDKSSKWYNQEITVNSDGNLKMTDGSGNTLVEKVSDELLSTMNTIYSCTATPTVGTAYNVGTNYASLAITSKTYTDGTATKYSINDVNGAAVTAFEYDDISSLLGVSTSVLVSQAVTTEATTTTTELEGQYTIAVESLTDTTNNVAVDISALNNPSFALVFNTDNGAFSYVGADGSNAFTVNLSLLGGDFSNISVDCSTSKNYYNGGTSTIGITGGTQDGAGSGRKVGNMSGFTIGLDGRIYATYDNGQKKLLGQIATATFANAAGLSAEGDNLYSETQNSGTFDGIGVDISAGGGYMSSGVLEMSNVDLSSQFTEMITTQRGFQANSRIITVSDTMLEELTNLKR